MIRKNEKIAELTYLFRIVQLVHEVDSIDKIYRMLISFCTSGRILGCRRAVLFTIDRTHRMLRGVYGLERTGTSRGTEDGALSFEEMAREVFDGFEKVESTDLTIHAKTFNVPLEWHRSALVKAVRTSYPVFAEGRLSEFATDPYFSFFDTPEYVAIPLRTAGTANANDDGKGTERVTAVLAADGSKDGNMIGVERISLLHSLVQQAALAIHNLKTSAESDRRFRVLTRLSENTRRAESAAQIEEMVKQGMSIMCRALTGTGSILKDFGTNRTLFIKTEHDFSLSSAGSDETIAEDFESVLDRAAGSMAPVQGDGTHPLLEGTERIAWFVAQPLIVRNDVIGALAFYAQKSETESCSPLTAMDMLFLEIGAGLLAEAISARNMEERLKRSDEFLEELRSNLSRERGKSRLGDRAIEYSETLRDELERIKKTLGNEEDCTETLPVIKTMLAQMEERAASYLECAAQTKSGMRNIDLFKVISRIAAKWRGEMGPRGIEVDLKIPARGPHLLMDRKRMARAFRNIFTGIGSSLAEGDHALVECMIEEDIARIVIADSGRGLPGDILSRLFMPFHDIPGTDELKNALSLAGEIIGQHGGEIVMKTSLSWKTILILSFKTSANRDRRRQTGDRRTRGGDRRSPVKQT